MWLKNWRQLGARRLLRKAKSRTRELGGKGPVFYYTVYMFRKAGVQINAFYCTVFIGVGRLASTCASACTLDVLGRRPLLAATALICAVSEGVAGAFLILEVEGTEWVPLASVIVFVISYGIGLGPIPWAYLGELLPTPVRSLGSSIINFGYSIILFTVSLVFLKEVSYLGLGLTLLLFGGANLAIVPLVLLFIPETKGRTLQDLEKAFTSRKKIVQEKDNPAFEMELPNAAEGTGYTSFPFDTITMKRKSIFTSDIGKASNGAKILPKQSSLQGKQQKESTAWIVQSPTPTTRTCQSFIAAAANPFRSAPQSSVTPAGSVMSSS
ncbi:facilitated trehalose transporter Tret1-like [Penaeus indicus]|uniref:facilitated trehalose transporter Tret1-like n=1 Tax=Penaeus indicus TaxID=29960 RepID=UPI00300CF4A2